MQNKSLYDCISITPMSIVIEFLKLIANYTLRDRSKFMGQRDREIWDFCRKKLLVPFFSMVEKVDGPVVGLLEKKKKSCWSRINQATKKLLVPFEKVFGPVPMSFRFYM